jgi:hypothetical protein
MFGPAPVDRTFAANAVMHDDLSRAERSDPRSKGRNGPYGGRSVSQCVLVGGEQSGLLAGRSHKPTAGPDASPRLSRCAVLRHLAIGDGLMGGSIADFRPQNCCTRAPGQSAAASRLRTTSSPSMRGARDYAGSGGVESIKGQIIWPSKLT